MNKKLLSFVHALTKGKMLMTHIEEEIDRHILIMKYSSIIFIPLMMLLLLFWLERNKFYFDVFLTSVSAFIAASFFPDIIALALLSVNIKNIGRYYRILHSGKGLFLFSAATFALFFVLFTFQKALLITFFGFLGYSIHLFIDKIEKAGEFLRFIIKRFSERFGICYFFLVR